VAAFTKATSSLPKPLKQQRKNRSKFHFPEEGSNGIENGRYVVIIRIKYVALLLLLQEFGAKVMKISDEATVISVKMVKISLNTSILSVICQ
jgi:hypothetical protein